MLNTSRSTLMRAIVYYCFEPLALLLFFLFLTGCLAEEESQIGTESDTSVVSEPAPAPVLPVQEVAVPPLTAPERTICDPFSVGPAARDRGLVGNLLFFDRRSTDPIPTYTGVEDFMNNASIVESTIYFDRMFIPTRPWDRPFVTETGQDIVNSYGENVYEYFALRMESQLQLAAAENPGSYQIALLSDDGSTLSWKNPDGSESTFINNDGNHSTKLKCATSPVTLDRNSKLPFVLKYYQGPRFHISMVMLMRPWPDGTDPDVPVNDPQCNQMGNSRFFDSTQNPVVPKTAFYEMLSRGWKVMENENFYFPSQSANPCVPDEPPLSISSYLVESLTRNSVTLTWTTNIAASSQIEFKNLSTNVVTQTAAAAGPTTSHRVVVSGLLANTLYSFKAISKTVSGQTAFSDEKALRTPR